MPLHTRDDLEVVSVAQSIAFHSYKGGTGKTTLACNLAAALVMKGNNVSLVDLDVYAPSLQAYFDQSPRKWINDFLLGNAATGDIMVDMTSAIESNATSQSKNAGKLWVGFSNPTKEEIFKLDGDAGKPERPKLQLLSKFIALRENLISEFDSDYVIIDTSPGIRFWSINSLAIADILLLTLKFGELDIEGTRRIANDMYSAFAEYGAKPFLLLNRVAGYCIPHTSTTNSKEMLSVSGSRFEESEIGNSLSRDVGMDLVSAVPCYCDIQFDKREFLTALRYPQHPFAEQIEALAKRIA